MTKDEDIKLALDKDNREREVKKLAQKLYLKYTTQRENGEYVNTNKSASLLAFDSAKEFYDELDKRRDGK